MQERNRWARNSGVTGVKWRCLKEQRKKFAITMTVNIQHVHLGLAIIEVSLQACQCLGNVTCIFFKCRTKIASRLSVLTLPCSIGYLVCLSYMACLAS